MTPAQALAVPLAHQECQAGAHQDQGADLLALVKGVENLTKWLRTQA